jgi:hypothetical protein
MIYDHGSIKTNALYYHVCVVIKAYKYIIIYTFFWMCPHKISFLFNDNWTNLNIFYCYISVVIWSGFDILPFDRDVQKEGDEGNLRFWKEIDLH